MIRGYFCLALVTSLSRVFYKKEKVGNLDEQTFAYFLFFVGVQVQSGDSCKLQPVLFIEGKHPLLQYQRQLLPYGL